METTYFTSNLKPMTWDEVGYNLINSAEEDPNLLIDGTLYRVTVEKVGSVRTVREVEFND